MHWIEIRGGIKLTQDRHEQKELSLARLPRPIYYGIEERERSTDWQADLCIISFQQMVVFHTISHLILQWRKNTYILMCRLQRCNSTCVARRNSLWRQSRSSAVKRTNSIISVQQHQLQHSLQISSHISAYSYRLMHVSEMEPGQQYWRETRPDPGQTDPWPVSTRWPGWPGNVYAPVNISAANTTASNTIELVSAVIDNISEWVPAFRLKFLLFGVVFLQQVDARFDLSCNVYQILLLTKLSHGHETTMWCRTVGVGVAR